MKTVTIADCQLPIGSVVRRAKKMHESRRRGVYKESP